MIAQISSDMVKGLPVLLVSIGALLWIWNQGAEAWGRTKGKPANEELHSSQEDLARRVAHIESGMVGVEWFAKMDKDIASLQADVKKDRDDHEQHISMRASKIYGEMKENTETLRGELKANADSVRADLKDQGDRRVIQIDDVRRELMGHIGEVRRELSEDIKAMPLEVVTLLKNTNAI